MRDRPDPVTPPHFLQARVIDARSPVSPEPLTSAFRAHAPHQIVVRVGPGDATWIAAPDAFPDEELPESDQPHRLQVVFTDLRLEREPQTGEIVLPRQGPSSEIRFALQAGNAGERIEERIIILHRNRVLQTALLRGDVVADPVAAESDAEIEIVTEVIARAHLDDLTGRSRFDAALVLNHDEKGQSRLTRIAGERVDVAFPPVDLDEAVSLLRGELDAFINIAEDIVALESERMRKLLIYLASQGASLYGTLVDDRIGTTFAKAARIQIVAAVPEAYLPIEFVYDRVAPRDDATVCPHARQALEQGTCPPGCRDHVDDDGVVCPLGFWCLTKVIERHVHTPERAEDVRRDFSLLREPSPKRVNLGPLTNTAFAASVKVDEYKAGVAAEALKNLRAVTGAEVGLAETWEEWITGIEKLSPSLLVLLPHTLSARGIATLEVGKSAHLGSVHIKAAHVRGSPDALPIVLLLGCKTGDPKLAFQKFPAAFRRRGAAIVLATLTTVLGRHAAPVAVRIVTAMVEQSKQKDATFGDVMLDMRRKLLLDGYPMVLALTAYGDADWRFGTPDA
jgi:hypothetical protein